MAEKKYKGRKAYLNDFKKNAQGNYEYQGFSYEWQGSKEALRKELIILWGISIGMLAALTVAGCIDAPGALNCFYVVLPYTISFVFGISAVWGMWRLFEGGNPLRSYVYEASIVQIPIRTIGVMIGSGVAVLGEIIFLFQNGFAGKAGECVIFLLLEVISLGFAWILRRRIQGMLWKKIDKSS